ncbi:hypothetical protein [Williamsia sp. CHRR-6]|uniref:hypothetical protein n=1 Tax=Williamsia sp. CHRR-6 TaxID=2835871 RepID=UPI001BDA1597|nr:hypothetical protein [Williamsia sp. CHRR-6]MBT0568586.1 hypothetical protein [Williamsia sp. CHRR-6]
MSSPLYSIPSGAGGSQLQFDPAAAASILSSLDGLHWVVSQLAVHGEFLSSVQGCGDFSSGVKIKAALEKLGAAAKRALAMYEQIAPEIYAGVQSAAKNLLGQDDSNRDAISKAGVDEYKKHALERSPQHRAAQDAVKNAKNSWPLGLLAHTPGLGGMVDDALQAGARQVEKVGQPSQHETYDAARDHYENIVKNPKPSGDWKDKFKNKKYDPDDYNNKFIPGGKAAGGYPVGAAPENAVGAILDLAHQMLQHADGPQVATLAALWRGIADSLLQALDLFEQQTKAQFEAAGSGGAGWEGNAATAIYAGLQRFRTSAEDVAKEMASVGNAAVHFSEGLVLTKPQIDAWWTERQTMRTTAAASGATAAAVAAREDEYERLARDLITMSYNPKVVEASGGMSYISDPHNPVASAPMVLPGMPAPPAPAGYKGTSGPVPKSMQTQSSSSNAGGPTGGPSGGPSGGPNAAQLTRAANADAVAKEAAAKTAAAQQAAAKAAAAGNPAAAAQSAASQAGNAAKGLAGAGSGLGKGAPSAATRSASALANAEKAAAEKAAAALGKGGGAGGGGAGGGGLGGAAAAERALQARAGSMGAAERMVAAEQAALQNGRPGAPGAMGGAPMGGARPGGEGGEGKGHKTARYLNSKANGEELVGGEQEVAPTVIGGLNLDTTDDRPVRGGGGGAPSR